MEKHAEDRKIIDFAFSKFLSRKYPVWADSEIYTDNHTNKYHNHDFPQLWYCLNGTYINRVEDTDYECTKGSVVIVPPGVFHQVSVPKGESAEIVQLNVMYDFYLNFPIEQYINTVGNLFLPPFKKELGISFSTHIKLSQESQAVMEECLSWFAVLEYTHSAVELDMQIRKKLETMFSIPEFTLPEKLKKKAEGFVWTRLDPIIRVVAYLNTNYEKKLTVDNIVRVSAICRANVYRYFKLFTGYTYSQYLQRLRTKHVYFYLKNTTYPLSYISDMCGFYDISHMGKVYYRYMRVKPKEFRTEKKKWLEENPQYKMRMP